MTMKAALIGYPPRIEVTYGGGRRERLADEFDLYPDIITKDNLNDKQADLSDIELLFSTWGMPALDSEQIALFPSLQALFYGAGTVQKFARPFLASGVKVVSAWGANAIPVAEYTVAHIILAMKGGLPVAHSMRSGEDWRMHKASSFPGSYESTVALLGAGMIGRAVIERLQPYKMDVIVFDPFLSAAEAAVLGVVKVELAEAFKRGFVVSNHLANLPETQAMLRGELFESMQPNATFINTGRGATVDEAAMIKVLQDRPTLSAVLDVTHPEPPVDDSPLYALENVVLTPHLAGATGTHEIWRMADFMIDEAIALREGRSLNFEVTLEMLKTMA
jgi:phosphoglycerate dehydrogenase-like enzyme